MTSGDCYVSTTHDRSNYRYGLDGSIHNLPIRYCGVRETFDRRELVYVQRGDGDEARLLAPRPYPPLSEEVAADQRDFGWGYCGGGPLSLAFAILCDFYNVESGAEGSSWLARFDGLTHNFMDQILATAPNLWLLTDQDIRHFVGRWAAGKLLVDRLRRRLSTDHSADVYHGEDMSDRMLLRGLVPEHIRDSQPII